MGSLYCGQLFMTYLGTCRDHPCSLHLLISLWGSPGNICAHVCKYRLHNLLWTTVYSHLVSPLPQCFLLQIFHNFLANSSLLMVSFLVFPHSYQCHLFIYSFCYTKRILQGKKIKHLHPVWFQNDESLMTFKAGPTICLDKLPPQPPLGHLSFGLNINLQHGNCSKDYKQDLKTWCIAGNQ